MVRRKDDSHERCAYDERDRRKFDSEWVLVGNPTTDPGLKVRSGHVLFHSKDRDEVYRAAVKLHPKRFAMLHVGALPKDVAIVL